MNDATMRTKVAVIQSKLDDHIVACTASNQEIRDAIQEVRNWILRGGVATLAALFYIIYELLKSKGTF